MLPKIIGSCHTDVVEMHNSFLILEASERMILGLSSHGGWTLDSQCLCYFVAQHNYNDHIAFVHIYENEAFRPMVYSSNILLVHQPVTTQSKKQIAEKRTFIHLTKEMGSQCIQ